MIVFDSGAWLNLLAIVFLGVMTFAPVRFIHPLRVIALRRLTVLLLIVWTIMVFVYLGIGRDAMPNEMNILFLLLSIYFLILSAWRSWALRKTGIKMTQTKTTPQDAFAAWGCYCLSHDFGHGAFAVLCHFPAFGPRFGP